MLPHRQAGKFASVLLGTAVIALALSQFHTPAGLAEGGSFGFSLLLYHQFGLSPAITCCVLDALLLLYAARMYGKAFICRSLLAVAGYSVFYALFDRLFDPLPALVQSPFTAAAIGGLLLGIGTALIIRTGTACGGDDAAAIILSQRLKLPIGITYLLPDGIVLLLCTFLLPAQIAAASLLSCLISSGTVCLLQQPLRVRLPRPAG